MALAFVRLLVVCALKHGKRIDRERKRRREEGRVLGRRQHRHMLLSYSSSLPNSLALPLTRTLATLSSPLKRTRDCLPTFFWARKKTRARLVFSERKKKRNRHSQKQKSHSLPPLLLSTPTPHHLYLYATSIASAASGSSTRAAAWAGSVLVLSTGAVPGGKDTGWTRSYVRPCKYSWLRR